MNQGAEDNLTLGKSLEGLSGFLHFAGFRTWTASLLPAIAGTTLPFWLRPPGFSFRWLGAMEFLFAAVLFHAGFSFLHAWFEKRLPIKRSRSRLLGYSCGCIVSACLLGLHINRGLQPEEHVYENIFIAYGISVIIIGLLYVAPPVSLSRRIGGEVVISVGLGMMPVLGAYLVQAADLTRKVYVASLPLVAATGLWVWIDRLISRMDDEKEGRRTLVMEFGPRLSGRYGVPAIVLLLFAALLAAVFSASLNPWVLVTLLFGGLAWRIMTVFWTGHLYPGRMIAARRSAFQLHFILCFTVAVSSWVTRLG